MTPPKMTFQAENDPKINEYHVKIDTSDNHYVLKWRMNHEFSTCLEGRNV